MKIIALNIIVILMLLLAACQSTTEGPAETPARDDATQVARPDQESWQSHITITREGRLVARVWANYIAAFNKEQKTHLEDSIHVDFLNSKGQHNSVLTANRGVVENNSRNLTATGNVMVVSDSGVVLWTEELLWDNNKQKIISNVPVKFATASDTLFGDSFVSDPDLRNYEIQRTRGTTRRLIPVEK